MTEATIVGTTFCDILIIRNQPEPSQELNLPFRYDNTTSRIFAEVKDSAISKLT